MREDDGKEARIEEAHVKTKEELEGGEVREEACRSPVAVSWGDVDQVCKRECAKERMAG